MDPMTHSQEFKAAELYTRGSHPTSITYSRLPSSILASQPRFAMCRAISHKTHQCMHVQYYCIATPCTNFDLPDENVLFGGHYQVIGEIVMSNRPFCDWCYSQRRRQLKACFEFIRCKRMDEARISAASPGDIDRTLSELRNQRRRELDQFRVACGNPYSRDHEDDDGDNEGRDDKDGEDELGPGSEVTMSLASMMRTMAI